MADEKTKYLDVNGISTNLERCSTDGVREIGNTRLHLPVRLEASVSNKKTCIPAKGDEFTAYVDSPAFHKIRLFDAPETTRTSWRRTNEHCANVPDAAEYEKDVASRRWTISFGVIRGAKKNRGGASEGTTWPSLGLRRPSQGPGRKYLPAAGRQCGGCGPARENRSNVPPAAS